VGEGFVREFQQSTINRPVPAAFFEQVVAESRKLPADVWKQVLDGLLGYQPQWPITCPTTILGGDRDAVFGPEDQMALFFATERSTFHLEPGIGHSLHWEWPERFVSLAFADNDRNGRESW
jgi:pimeloyl-ACP methyl ester carboxylesterase